jgi:hypothetical protein
MKKITINHWCKKIIFVIDKQWCGLDFINIEVKHLMYSFIKWAENAINLIGKKKN